MKTYPYIQSHALGISECSAQSTLLNTLRDAQLQLNNTMNISSHTLNFLSLYSVHGRNAGMAINGNRDGYKYAGA